MLRGYDLSRCPTWKDVCTNRRSRLRGSYMAGLIACGILFSTLISDSLILPNKLVCVKHIITGTLKQPLKWGLQHCATLAKGVAEYGGATTKALIHTQILQYMVELG